MRALRTIRVGSCALALLWLSAANATNYYISSSLGNDSNDGLTPATAWKSLSKINSVTFATSDGVYLLAGDTFNNSGSFEFNIGWSGTASNPVVIGAYHTDANGNPVSGPGSAARPKIVSTHVFVVVTSPGGNSPYDYTAALNITGNYINVSDLEADNYGEGIRVTGTNVTVTNFLASKPYWCGLSIEFATNVKVTGSEVVGDSQGFGKWGETGTWCAAIGSQGTQGLTVQNTYIHEGWGEGINSFKGSSSSTIANNLVYAQRAVGIYIDWSQNVDIHGNLVYGTSSSTYWRQNSFTGPGVALNNEPNEVSDTSKMTKNVAVYDNLIAGTGSGVAQWYSGTLPNVSIYNNTLVDNRHQIDAGSCTGCVAENNIFLSLSSGAVDVPSSETSGGTAFHNNYWSQGAPSGTGFADSSTDVYSGLTLTKMTGWQSISSASSLPPWQSFAPLAGSTTFQKGTTLLPAPYNLDYNGNPHRNPMDMGGIAGSGGGGPVTPVAAFACSPLSGSVPLAVTCTDASSNSPTNWNWTFGDSGTGTAQNPSHTYSSAGTYTVALTASNSAGSNTLTKSGYVTVTASGGSVTPNPAAPGQAITITDTFAATVTDSSAEVVYWVVNSANSLLGRCVITSTSITSGQQTTVPCTFTIPSSAATGTYHVSGTIYQSSSNATAIQSLTTFATFTIN